MKLGSICMKLAPQRMSNPDLDIRYLIPDKIEALTGSRVKSRGYDFDDDHLLIYLQSAKPKDDIAEVLEILKQYDFKGNRLFGIAELFFSDRADTDLGEAGSGYLPYPYTA